MKFLWIILFALFLLFTLPNAWAQTPKPLTELKPVSGGCTIEIKDRPFSITGRIMHFGLGVAFYDVESSVYDLGGNYTRFEAWVGIPDNYSKRTDKSFSIRLDGKLVLTNESDPLNSGDAPIHISVDVTGAQAIQIRGLQGIFFGEPVLYRGTPLSANIATLVAPQDGITVSTTSIKLLWEPVSNATSYGVEIVCTKGSSPHIYALNASDSITKFDLSGVPNGEYHWSVIAFDNKGAMGKFSKDRTFIVAH